MNPGLSAVRAVPIVLQRAGVQKPGFFKKPGFFSRCISFGTGHTTVPGDVRSVRRLLTSQDGVKSDSTDIDPAAEMLTCVLGSAYNLSHFSSGG